MTSSLTSLTAKSSPSLVHELRKTTLTVCGVACEGSVSVPTTNGIVTVPDAGVVGAAANVVGLPSTLATSALPNDPVHDAGRCTVIAPVMRSSSLGTCVQVF